MIVLCESKYAMNAAAPCIIFWISLGVKNLIGSIICCGSSSVLLISFPNLFCDVSFGLNTISKCAAKLFAFSLSLRAQVWSALPIDGVRCVGCFNLLVAFQSD
jgi:hypothetical protein